MAKDTSKAEKAAAESAAEKTWQVSIKLTATRFGAFVFDLEKTANLPFDPASEIGRPLVAALENDLNQRKQHDYASRALAMVCRRRGVKKLDRDAITAEEAKEAWQAVALTEKLVVSNFADWVPAEKAGGRKLAERLVAWFAANGQAENSARGVEFWHNILQG